MRVWVWLLLVPLASAQAPGLTNPTGPSPVDLYFHLDGFQEFPINTQKPANWTQSDVSIGLSTHTTTCLPGGPATGGQYHTLYGFSSPGYVQYDIAEGGRPRSHPERELSYDVQVDPAGEARLTWYLSTWTGVPRLGPNDPNQVPVVVPNVVVRATLRTGEDLGLGEAGYNAGQLLARGVSAPATLAGPATQGATYLPSGNQNIYAITVPLHFETGTIGKKHGFVLRVDTYMDNPACDPETGTLMPNLVRIHSSDAYRPHMQWPVLNALRLEYLHPQLIADGLIIHASANSPFGNYDVDEWNLSAQIDGPSSAPSLRLASLTQRTHDHDHHTQAMDFSFLWPYRDDGAVPGNYTLTVRITNDQHTATATGVSIVELGAKSRVTACSGTTTVDCQTETQDAYGNRIGVKKESPLGGVGLLLALGLALAVRAKRD